MLVVMVMTVTSCDSTTVYDHYDHTPTAGWEKNDSLAFGPIKIEGSGEYSEELGLRVNGAYPFQSLCLVVEHHIYPKGVVLTDTLNCAIVNRDGSVRGQGVSYFQYNFPLKDSYYNSGDSILIYVRHNMKREILPGVSDIGLKVTAR